MATGRCREVGERERGAPETERDRKPHKLLLVGKLSSNGKWSHTLMCWFQPDWLPPTVHHWKRSLHLFLDGSVRDKTDGDIRMGGHLQTLIVLVLFCAPHPSTQEKGAPSWEHVFHISAIAYKKLRDPHVQTICFAICKTKTYSEKQNNL